MVIGTLTDCQNRISSMRLKGHMELSDIKKNKHLRQQWNYYGNLARSSLKQQSFQINFNMDSQFT